MQGYNSSSPFMQTIIIIVLCLEGSMYLVTSFGVSSQQPFETLWSHVPVISKVDTHWMKLDLCVWAEISWNRLEFYVIPSAWASSSWEQQNTELKESTGITDTFMHGLDSLFKVIDIQYEANFKPPHIVDGPRRVSITPGMSSVKS